MGLGRRGFAGVNHLAVLLSLACFSSAQQYSFDHLGQENGMGSALVRAITQDRQGFLYVGTRLGVFRYDGVRFASYGTEQGLPDEHVRSLHTTRQGELWVATTTGLARLHGNRFRAIDSLKARIPSMTALDSDSKGNLFVATEQGLFHVKSDLKVSRIPAPDPARGVYEHEDEVWFGCGKGICLYHQERVQIFDSSQGVPESAWSGFATTADGTLWARGEGRLLVKKQGDAVFRNAERVPFVNAGQLISDLHGRLLVPTRDGLWVRESAGTWTSVGEQSGLPANTINCLYQDREGGLWIGTAEVGIFRWRGFKDWEGYTLAQGLNRNRISSIAMDSQGTLWSGTNQGLNRFDRGTKQWTPLAPLKPIPVRALQSTPDGYLWVATVREGLLRLRPSNGQLLPVPPSSGLDNPDILSLVTDPEGKLWVATTTGMYRLLNSGPQPRFEKMYPEILPPRATHGAVFDTERRLWVAGRAGLWRLEDGQWSNFTKKDGLRADSLVVAATPSDGSVWVGYADQHGVSRLRWEGKKLRIDHFDRSNQLRSNDISFIRSDSRGWIWVGTDNGVDVFNGSNWRHLATPDGLIWHDTVLNAFHEDANGSVWIGTNRGIAHYRPAQDIFDLEPPLAALTQVRFGNKLTVPADRTLTIPFANRFLQIEFATLSFSRQHVARFRYRLLGLENRWVVTNQREASFPNLAAGEYRFEVQAAAGGDWSPTSASMNFRIEAPWWQQPWFTGGIAVSMLAGVVFFIRSRTLQGRRQRADLEAAVAQRTEELELEKSRTELEKKRVERQKQEIELLLKKAEDASRFKSQFLANVSHEIRTPMNAILGMTELALNTHLSEEQQDCLETVKSSGESLLGLLNDILDLSKIEANRLELESVPFSLRTAVEGCMRMFFNQALGKGLILESSVFPDVPDALIGDPNRLRQILLNLVSNGLKFTNEGSVSLLVSVEDRSDSTAVLRFTVSDSGIGIPHDKQALIFEAFHQGDGSTTRRFGGTGLGLAICLRLVAMMGGAITVKSEIGKGSQFSFTAGFGISSEIVALPDPMGDYSEISSLASALGRDGLRRMRILVAEDNPVNQRLILRMLEKLGHQVDVAADGLEAVRLISQKQFDLVLMDVQMPELDGLEATRRIRSGEQENGNRLPILVLTANAMLGDKEKCIEAGADGYLSKPVSLQQLSRAVEDAALRPPQAG